MTAATATPDMISPQAIMDFRETYGFSQCEFGDAIDIERGYISSIEQGARKIKPWFSDLAKGFMDFVRECDKDGRL